MTMTESTPQTAPQTAPPAAPAPSTELLVSMTEAASAKVMELRSREGKSEAALRLFVKSGGCSGFSYGLAFDDKIADDDRVEDHAGVPIVIDAYSAQYVDGAERAIRCASAISEAAAKLGLGLRCGVHSGEVELIPDNVRGVTVHVVSRITALAQAGEVLVSGTTHELVADSSLSFDDRGSHELKGVTGARQVWAVVG